MAQTAVHVSYFFVASSFRGKMLKIVPWEIHRGLCNNGQRLTRGYPTYCNMERARLTCVFRSP